MKITYVTADSPQEWNCSEWRCAIPARAINRHPRHSATLLDMQAFAENTPEAQAVCAAADVIVVQRSLFGPVLNAIQRWKARDKVLVVDFDDAYQLMPPQVSSYAFWREGRVPHSSGRPGEWETLDPSPLTQFKWGLRLAHGATVPSTRLADDWRSFQEIHTVPNYLELEKYTNVTGNHHTGITIGWGGSFSHLQSFQESGLLSALKRVCQARKHVHVLICGDPRVYDAIPVPTEQKRFLPWVSAAEWPRALAQFDVGLAPLAGEYDQRRSWIKPLEYMVMKIPWVASEGSAYHDLRSFGWLVQNTPGAWERVLLDMVDHLDSYQAEANGEPYLFGISQNIDENIDRVISVYSAIASRGLDEPAHAHAAAPDRSLYEENL